jgi:hypothetical protein
MLGPESNRVVGLRIAKLMRGGKAAQREARRMVQALSERSTDQG